MFSSALLLLLGTPAGAQELGSDAYGYLAVEVPYAWNGASGLIGMNAGDDGEQVIALPWPFPWYGVDYTEITIGTNGGVFFGNTGQVEPTPECLPSAIGPDIAVFWDDWDYGFNDVRWTHDTNNDVFLVRWDATLASAGGSAQLQLFPSGKVVLAFGDTDFDATYNASPSLSIGIQNATGGTALFGDAIDLYCTELPAGSSTISIETCFDADGDGLHDPSCGGLDCDETDPTVYTGAPEPCDGIDSDCGGLPTIWEPVPDLDSNSYFGVLAGNRYEVTSAATLDVAEIYCALSDQPTELLILESDSRDGPYRIVKQEQAVGPTGYEWHSFGGLAYPLTPGTYVWVAWLTPDNTTRCYRDISFSTPVATSFGQLIESAVLDKDLLLSPEWFPVDETDGYAIRLGVNTEADRDGDGLMACEECNDGDPASYPGAVEICDGLDNDCDGIVPASEVDLDGDGSPACADCDDTDPFTGPGFPELCDGLDNDCDGIVPPEEFVDTDADGFLSCADCDDADPTVHPGAVELCDGIDGNCDGLLTTMDAAPFGWEVLDRTAGIHAVYVDTTVTLDSMEAYLDVDPGTVIDWFVLTGDGPPDGAYPFWQTVIVQTTAAGGEGWYSSGPIEFVLEAGTYYGLGSYTLNTAKRFRTTPGTATFSFGSLLGELYNHGYPSFDGRDPQLGDQVSWGMRFHTQSEIDGDGDGVPACLDCIDSDPSIYPGAPEICDSKDNDCDGVQLPEEVDNDGDSLNECADLDCDDTDPSVFPGAPEICDAQDSDCDGTIPAYELDDVDGDGSPYCLDCDDTDPLVSPLAVEICDGIDTDCDGFLEETVWEGPPATGVQVFTSTGGNGNHVIADRPGRFYGFELWLEPTDPWDDIEFRWEVYERTPNGPWVERYSEYIDHVEIGNGWYASNRFDIEAVVDNEYVFAVYKSTFTDGVYLDFTASAGSASPTAIGRVQGTQFWYNTVPDPGPGGADPGAYRMRLIETIDVDNDGDGSPSCLDCDDTDPTRAPGAAELCDGIDNDCDGVLPSSEIDDDGDGFTECDGDCSDFRADAYPGAPELCNGLDDDCDFAVPADESDDDGDFYRICDGDCDDLEPATHPGAWEQCDFADNDCDGLSDNGDPDSARTVLWAAVFEGGGDGAFAWAPVGHPVQWEVGVPTGTSPAAYQGSQVWATELDGPYTWGGVESYLQLPTVDLPPASLLPPVMKFAYYQANYSVGSCGPHHTTIEVNPGSGVWTPLADGDGCAGGLEDTNGVWVEREIDLSAYAGQVIDIRFNHSTYGGYVAALGTYIDDVIIEAFVDLDLDGWSTCLDCDDADSTVFPGSGEVCDGADNDCDGLLGPGEVDLDGDGALACVDCDDADPLRYPGATEACDGIDNDCDGIVPPLELVDGDSDGALACADCSDSDPMRFPGAVEVCNGVDDDCDGSAIDETDADGDGVFSCAGDCDDSDPTVASGLPEQCDGLDNDCNGSADFGGPGSELDSDGDGFLACAECDDGDPTVGPGFPELCDGLDNDCDGIAGADVYGELDGDGDGFLSCADCNDFDAAVFPGAIETCNGRDDDCDPTTLENVDMDGDGISLCAGDCDETDPTRASGLLEVCDGVDNDCNPATDEDADLDGDGASLCDGDCDDTDASRLGGAVEACDGVDNDCDGALGADEVDEDGDGWLVCQGDCDDAAVGVFPGAPEICDDGIDSDCDGADLPCPSGTGSPTGTGTGSGTGTGTGTGGTTPAGSTSGTPGTGIGSAPTEPKGCGCATGNHPGGVLPILLLLALTRRRQLQVVSSQ